MSILPYRALQSSLFHVEAETHDGSEHKNWVI